MKNILFGIMALVAAAAFTLASDAEVKAEPACSWTGFHVGINMGYGFGGDNSTQLFPVTPNFYPVFSLGVVPRPTGLSPDGFVGGGQAGYDHQFGRYFLAGIETDLQYANIRDKTSALAKAPGFVLVQTDMEQALRFFGTVRARVGVLPLPQLLIYGTGGFAYGNTKTNSTITNMEFPEQYSSGVTGQVKTGWTAGGGVEWAFWKNWSVRTEYLYYDLGKGDNNRILPTVLPIPAEAGSTFVTNGHIVRTGINYRF
jgi:outer membrane immunogenic protein